MIDKGARVLITDDEEQIRRFLRVALEAQGYQVGEATSGRECLRQATTFHPDIILLDLGLPDTDGLELLRGLREWSQVPVVILSVREREEDKIAALDSGADDYITKPFSSGELLARLRVALRHAAKTGDEPVVTVGGLTIDLVHRRVEQAGRLVKLTPIEYELLKLLAINAGKVVTHRQLLSSTWGKEYQKKTHYLRVYLRSLRRKIESDPTRPRYLITEPGVGYRLSARED